MRRSLAILALSVFLGASPAPALTPRLVKDINPTTRGADSNPQSFVALPNGVSLFVARDGDGYHLWRSDGTAAGTYPLLDPCDQCLGAPQPLALAGDRAYFWWPMSGNSSLLLVTGGSKRDSFELADGLRPGSHPKSGAAWVASRRTLLFVAADEDGEELWRSDGTPAGTHQVVDLQPGRPGSDPMEITAVGDRVFFIANDGRSGFTLWSSDGTAAGTRLVGHGPRGSSFSSPQELQRVGSLLLFFASTRNRGLELWRSDGTGTRVVADVVPGPQGFRSVAGNLGVHAGRLWFVADAGRGFELWVSDGTARGTRVLTDVLPSALPATLNGRLVFPADDGRHGVEPWISDGTRAGTRLLRDICPGPCGSSPFGAAPYGSSVLFVAGTPTHGSTLWRTNGTAQGTRQIRSFAWPIFDFAASPVPGALLFAAREEAFGMELWRTDGTRPGTALLRDLHPGHAGSGSSPRGLQAVGSDLYFMANRDLWTSDGTAEGTLFLSHLQNGFVGDDLVAVPADGQVFLEEVEDAGYRHLYRTDGTPAGTVLLKARYQSPQGSRIVAVGSRAYFVAGDAPSGFELWTSDGTVDGTVQVADLKPGPAGSEPAGLTPFLGRLWFTADVDGERQIWNTSGTAASTRPAVGVSSRMKILGVHADRLWFVAQDSGIDNLWSADGTHVGIHPLALALGPFTPDILVPAGDRMFLAVRSGDPDKIGLWASVGYTEPQRLSPIAPAANTPVALAGGRLYYRAPGAGIEVLWQSDGTVEGTHPVLDAQGQQIPFHAFAAAGNFLYVRLAQDELWRTDGTPGGWEAVVTPGLDLVGLPTLAGSRLFIPAVDEEHGLELWVLE